MYWQPWPNSINRFNLVEVAGVVCLSLFLCPSNFPLKCIHCVVNPVVIKN